MWFVTRRRLNIALDEITRLRARVVATEKRLDKCEAERLQLARWLAEADTANRRLVSRNTELTRRLEDRTDAEHVACLEARVEELTALGVQANTKLDEMAAKVKAAEERANTARTARRETPTVDGAPNVRREASSARLRRAEARCAALQQRLDEMQVSHIADTRELHDLRQGATS